ncbi:minor fimbrial subunit [Salmonella enterica subsp. enterica]|uniref:Minor fimbrial subunit n=1 Tax=Salmonella enterica I TaxID=59201 RepID=A0A3S4ICB4_SALET|nr:minor fimbrial subunit [Salmonella enterica subsp. enterica]
MRQWRLRLGTVTCAAMLSAVSMPLAAGSKTVKHDADDSR